MDDTSLYSGVSDEVDLSRLSIAVAHWHVNAWGGAEYLVTKLAETLDAEEVYTIGTPDPDEPNPYGDVEWVDVSSGPGARLKRRLGRAGEYALWEDVDWREYGDPDVLVTSGATTRAVITPDDTLHVNYCHSPPRWLYDLYHDRKGSFVGRVARPAIRYLRLKDAAIDPRVDHYLANSPIVARRIWKYYKREAEVLYPPLDLEKYYVSGDEGFYLHLGRLDEEKGVVEVVDAFEELDERIVFAGGRGDVDDSVLERVRAADNMEYRGFVSEEEKLELLATCRAVVFNGVNEDFGIVPIEANASRKIILARDDGFPGLFVTDGVNGFLHEGTVTGIRRAVERSTSAGIDEAPGDSVEQFSTDTFVDRLDSAIVDWYERFDASTDRRLSRIHT